MERSPFNHGKSGDTNPRGQPRSWLLELYTRSPPSRSEEKAQLRNFCRLRRQTALCYTLDEDQRTEREVRNCPPKRVRSSPRFRVDPFLRPDDATASLQSHYRTFCTTIGGSSTD